MGKKGSKTTNIERPQSAQELRLLETQNQQIQAGIDIAKQQDDRSQDMYNDWQNNYQGMETGEMSPTANRANGYSNNPNIITQKDYDGYQGRLSELQRQLEQSQQGGTSQGSRTKGGR